MLLPSAIHLFFCSKKQNTRYSRTMEKRDLKAVITTMNPLSNTYIYQQFFLDDGNGAYHHNRQLFILRTPILGHDHIDCQTLTCHMLVSALSKKSVINRSHHTKNIRLREKKNITHNPHSPLTREPHASWYLSLLWELEVGRLVYAGFAVRMRVQMSLRDGVRCRIR